MPWTMNSGNMWKLSLASLAVGLAACITVESSSQPAPTTATEQDAGPDDNASNTATASGEKPKDEDDASSSDGGRPWLACANYSDTVGNGLACATINPEDGGTFNSKQLCPDECGGGVVYKCEIAGAQPAGLTCYVPPKGGGSVCCLEYACVRYTPSDSMCKGAEKAYFCPPEATRPAACSPKTGRFCCQ